MNSIFEYAHKVGDTLRAGVAAVTPVPTETKFIEEGTLTPQEFLQAGDQLCYKFPSWQWEKGKPANRAGYLPDEKQYLITRNVRCRERVRDLDASLQKLSMSEDWCLPPDTEDKDKPGGAGATGSKGGQKAAEKLDFGDLDNMLAGDDDDDIENDGFELPDSGKESTKLRTYDLSITYDKYYQTPRLWLFGYDIYGRPLESREIFQDVLSEYHSKTVTVDPHPLTAVPTCSIHPCKHAAVMKKVIRDWMEQGLQPRHDLALFVFLKFISSVVPTIDYDFTMDIEL
ncbi:unnamed protein product [Amoebophrya sp. A120]|nr:unnamed protein product [Amoebophrya sp. A120]|eukprot:GSA120T00004409001.1